MFCILPCATIKDKISLSPVGSASQVPQMDATRADIRKLSDIDYLLSLLQKGEVVMTKKVAFDNYLASHVDLMRAYVSTSTPCNFAYSSFFGGPDIDTTGMSQKDQWAFEIVMSRYNLSSIYHAGAYNSMRTIFTETAISYKQGAKTNAELVKNVQMTFQYFNEGYQPLKRLLPYFDAVQSLASPNSKNKFPELNRTIFESYTMMVTCNLAFLKIEKYRLLREFKKCKQASWAVHLRVIDCKSKLASFISQLKGSANEMVDFFQVAQIYYQILAYYFMLTEHQDSKNTQEYGFVKKQFQQMIHDNLVAIEQAERLYTQVKIKLAKQQNDNVVFGMGVLKIAMEEINKFKYRYSINVHENKNDKPWLQDVIARRIGASSIWESLDFF